MKKIINYLMNKSKNNFNTLLLIAFVTIITLIDSILCYPFGFFTFNLELAIPNYIMFMFIDESLIGLFISTLIFSILFIMLWFYGKKNKIIPFIGFGLYIIDALLYLMISEWGNVVFHIFIILLFIIEIFKNKKNKNIYDKSNEIQENDDSAKKVLPEVIVEVAKTKDGDLNIKNNIVVGFWIRLVSDFLDVIILGVIGIIITFPLKNIFFRIGENGLFIGIIITFFYTGILQSYIGHGQSIAKKLLKIQVLDINGNYLSLQRSFLRYTVIAFVFYNSWILTAFTSMFPFLNNVIYNTIYTFFIIFLFLSVTILIAIHPLKRGFHDLLANSIVVRKDLYQKEKIEELQDQKQIRRAYKMLVASSFFLIIIMSVMVLKINKTSPELGNLAIIQNEIRTKTDFTNVSVIHNTQTLTNSDGQKVITKNLNIKTFLLKNNYDNEQIKNEEINKALNTVLELYPEMTDIDLVNIQVRTGYNIGLNSYYTNETSSFDKKGNIIGEKKTGSNFRIGS